MKQRNEWHRAAKGVVDAMKMESEVLFKMGRIGTSRNYGSAYRSFGRFLSARGLGCMGFDKLTVGLLSDYEQWLWHKGVSRNSSSSYLRCMRAVYNKYMGTDGDNRLFMHVYTGCASTRKRAISAADMRSVIQLDIADALQKRTLNMEKRRQRGLERMAEKLECTRDYFVFCLSCRGLTFVDLAFLRHSDIDGAFISYRRKKTGQEIRVRLEPVMWNIIMRRQTQAAGAGAFLFPIIESGCRGMMSRWQHLPVTEMQYMAYRRALNAYNWYLKMLGKLVSPGLNLTSYVSRHTWATLAYRSEVPLPVISKAMGHASVQTTQIYLQSFTDSEIDLANRMVLKRYIDGVMG
ncbi:MAG: site-specific integrase [Bacteroidaceae bacterium]|nr:site-specific integrase [Bacteroidaceae bacterium]